MGVVTIRGQMGSGAPEIGKLIADRLNADYVDREIIEKVAKLLDLKQRDVREKEMPPGSFLSKVAAALGHMTPTSPGSPYVSAYVRTWEMPVDDSRYLEGLESIIKELAMSEPIVIRGRGSQFILRHWPRALHVLFVAPIKLRVRRVMEEMKLDEANARKEIERFDSSRRQFTRKYFRGDLEDPVNYDLVVNTQHLSVQSAALVVVNALPLKQ